MNKNDLIAISAFRDLIQSEAFSKLYRRFLAVLLGQDVCPGIVVFTDRDREILKQLSKNKKSEAILTMLVDVKAHTLRNKMEGIIDV